MSNPEDYHVGWICALHTEYVAARVMLDDRHDEPDSISTHDDNHYTLGRIGKHNVVIAVMSDGEYGTAMAAGVAKDMLHSFPNVRIGLMVGTGGGAPSKKNDIRLGDIVVSAPREGFGGVFQYDFGKTIQGQAFQNTRFLNQPPAFIREAINGLKARHDEDGHSIELTIDEAFKKKPRLRERYQRPDASSDRLYQSSLVHQDPEKLCVAICATDPSMLVQRPERTDISKIHYGLIASANQLMENAEVRDKLTAEKNVLCFEMEAAGLMNHFPCLVVRGIYNYSDTHKNKEWQGYAAMAAAAYAKDLLLQVPQKKVEAEKKINKVVSEVNQNMSEVITVVGHLQTNHHLDKVKEWLSSPEPSINLNKALEQRREGSRQSLLGSKAYPA